MIHTLDQLLARTEPDGDCLVWTGALAGKGYPVVRDDVDRYVHRLVLRLTDGLPIADHEQVAHTCGQSTCINPQHLRRCTQAENERDKVGHGTYRHGRPGESHCGRYLDASVGPKSRRCREAAGHLGNCVSTTRGTR